MIMNNKIYDVLKWIALILMPAAIACYAALSGIWGWPYGEQIVGTLSAVEVFMGAVLQISSANYKKISG
jgi:hypothetical protein